MEEHASSSPHLGSLRALARSSLPFPNSFSLLLLQEPSRQAGMCKADMAIFSLRAGEGACSHPTYSPGSHTQMPLHVRRRARGWKYRTANPTFPTVGSHHCHGPVFKVHCVNTGIKKIMKAGIKKIMKLGCSPAQGRQTFVGTGELTSACGGRAGAVPWASLAGGRLLNAGAHSRARGRGSGGTVPPLCRENSAFSFPLPFTPSPAPDSEVCITHELLGAAVR